MATNEVRPEVRAELVRAELIRAATPATIGPYKVVREIGRGGMGLVYEAVHGQLGKRVAIKTLRTHLLEDQANLQRFMREGRAACRIVHPHVVEIHELGDQAGVPYLVMDLLEGVHLGTLLEREGPIPLPQLADLMLPVLAAVSAAHAAGVVHRDLKPSNIMLARGRDGNLAPKVLDFGTSKLREPDPEELLTITGAVLGTLHYMSPEQTRAPRDADARSDQYSLGLIMYECATGKKPFAGAEGWYEIMQAIMTAPVEPPSARNPALPKQLDAVILRALRRSPRERFGSVAALGTALLPFASDFARKQWQEELATASALPEPEAANDLPVRESRDISQTMPESNGQLGRERFAAQPEQPARAARTRPLVAAMLIPVILIGLWVLLSMRAAPPALGGAARATQATSSVTRSESAPSPTKVATATASVQPAAQAPTATAARPQDQAAPAAAIDQPKAAPVAPRTKPKRAASIARIPLGDNDAPILE